MNINKNIVCVHYLILLCYHVSCTPLPPVRVNVTFTDYLNRVECNEVLPIFTKVSNDSNTCKLILNKSIADTCCWNCEVDANEDGDLYILYVKLTDTLFDTVITLDTVRMDKNKSSIIFDVALSNNFGEIIYMKKYPLLLRNTSTWDTIYLRSVDFDR